MPFHIGLLLFPDITQLDMTGPYEVFIKFPDAKVLSKPVHLRDLVNEVQKMLAA